MSRVLSNCLVIAGEKSGEEHALSFLPLLRDKYPEIQFWGVGGDDLKSHGVEILYHLERFSSWGYSEVISKIPFYYRCYHHLLDEVKVRECKVAILVDFQSFNLKLAKGLHEQGVTVLYYVAPQAWAWKRYRVKKIAKYVHTLFTIIPFEKNWFLLQGVHQVCSVAHPVWTKYSQFLKENVPIRKKSLLGQESINITLLPGSRNFEVLEQLPMFCRVCNELSKRFSLKVTLVKSKNVDHRIYESWSQYIDETYFDKDLSKALLKSDLSLATSGTVTLICALFQVPTVVSYRASLLNEFIYKTFVSYRGYTSLANIVHNQRLFPELVQEDASEFNIKRMMLRWIEGPSDYQEVCQKLKKTDLMISGEKGEPIKKMSEVFEAFNV